MNVSAYLKGSFQVQISVIVIVSDKLDKNWEKTDKKYVEKDMEEGGVKRVFNLAPSHQCWWILPAIVWFIIFLTKFEFIQTTLIFVWKKTPKSPKKCFVLAAFWGFFKGSPCFLSYWEVRNPRPPHGLELDITSPFGKKILHKLWIAPYLEGSSQVQNGVIVSIDCLSWSHSLGVFSY